MTGSGFGSGGARSAIHTWRKRGSWIMRIELWQINRSFQHEIGSTSAKGGRQSHAACWSQRADQGKRDEAAARPGLAPRARRQDVDVPACSTAIR